MTIVVVCRALVSGLILLNLILSLICFEKAGNVEGWFWEGNSKSVPFPKIFFSAVVCKDWTYHARRRVLTLNTIS